MSRAAKPTPCSLLAPTTQHGAATAGTTQPEARRAARARLRRPRSAGRAERQAPARSSGAASPPNCPPKRLCTCARGCSCAPGGRVAGPQEGARRTRAAAMASASSAARRSPLASASMRRMSSTMSASLTSSNAPSPNCSRFSMAAWRAVRARAPRRSGTAARAAPGPSWQHIEHTLEVERTPSGKDN